MNPLSRLATRARAAGLWQPFLADCRAALWVGPLVALFFVLAWVAGPPPSGDPSAAADLSLRHAAVDARATGGGR